jgi:hypothetical protein
MRPDQLTRLESLRDRLVERSLADADPVNWIAGEKAPKDMTRDERGDAKWCRSLAVSTVSLTLQVQRLMTNPAAGGALVPDQPDAAPAEDPVEAEVARFEAAAADVLVARAVKAARDGSAKR